MSDLEIRLRKRTLSDEFDRLRKINRAAIALFMHAKPKDGGGYAAKEWWDALGEALSWSAKYGDVRCMCMTPGGRCVAPMGHPGGHTA